MLLATLKRKPGNQVVSLPRTLSVGLPLQTCTKEQITHSWCCVPPDDIIFSHVSVQVSVDQWDLVRPSLQICATQDLGTTPAPPWTCPPVPPTVMRTAPPTPTPSITRTAAPDRRPLRTPDRPRSSLKHARSHCRGLYPECITLTTRSSLN